MIPRKNFVCHSLGNQIIVQGGQNYDTLGDFWLFDLESLEWIEVTGKQFFRSGHCSVLVLSSQQKLYNRSDNINFTKFPKENKKGVKEGVYSFGGLNRKDRSTNQMHFMDLGQSKFSFKKLIVKGIKPQPRTEATLAYKDDLEICILHGGRDYLLDVTFNDFFVLSLQNLEWLQVAIRGDAPLQRCNHISFVYNDKVCVFGGMNNRMYLGVDIYSVDLLRKKLDEGNIEEDNLTELESIERKTKPVIRLKKVRVKTKYEELD